MQKHILPNVVNSAIVLATLQLGIVIVTDINSHCAVRTAQKQCRKRGRRVLIVRKFGISSFEQAARAVRGEAPGPRVTTSLPAPS